VQGSLDLLESLVAAGCRRAVFVGSCFEYGSGGPLSESTPVDPRSLYAASKAATRYLAEHLARVRGIPFVWARFFLQYGPFEDPRRLVPAVMAALLRGEPVDVTRGVQVRDFLHVQDVAGAAVAVALSEVEGVVNIGSGTPVSVRELVSTIGELIGRPELIRYGARPDVPGDPPAIYADIGRLIATTGWRPRFDLRSGLEDTLEWWKGRLALA
jgi:nucleoside-diphosphate-sugar epimerase